jgi:polysaccharide pyruvyl transferase WcaK-like protein
VPLALIAGAFGQGNPGDEALLDAHLRVVDASGWDALITASDLGLVTPELRGAAIAPRGRAAASACRRADAIIVGGGTVFGRLHPSTGRPAGDLLRRTAALTAAARVFGTPIAFSGVGAAPVATASERALARGIVRACDLLVLRDEESAEELRAMGAPPPFRVGADPAWTVLDGVAEATRDIDLLIVMSHLAVHRGLVGWLAAAVHRLPEATRVTVVPWQQQGADGAISGALARILGGRADVVDAPVDLEAGASLAARAEVTLCLRFHGAMASAIAGTPFVAVGHEPKLKALARRLGAPYVDSGCAPNELAVAVRRAQENGPASQRLIDAERHRAHDGLRLLRLLLNRGAEYEDAMVPSLALVDGRA